MRGRIKKSVANSDTARTARFVRLVLAVCVVSQLGITGFPATSVAANEERHSTGDGNAAGDSSDGSKIISLKSLTTGMATGRPADFYRLESGTSAVCNQILDALNAPYDPAAHGYGGDQISKLFLGNKFSVRWQELEPSWVGAAKMDIDSSGQDEWIVKWEVSSPFFGEVLYWLPADVDPTKLARGKFWPSVTGGDDQQARLARNQISIRPLPARGDVDVKKIPRPMWDVISVSSKSFVVTAEMFNNKRPQRITVHVLAMRDRRHGDEMCSISTKALIAGITF